MHVAIQFRKFPYTVVVGSWQEDKNKGSRVGLLKSVSKDSKKVEERCKGMLSFYQQ